MVWRQRHAGCSNASPPTGLLAGPPTRVSQARKAAPGTLLIREWRGKAHQVTVHDDGVAYHGKRYRSLSEVARLITGTRWCRGLCSLVSGNRSGRLTMERSSLAVRRCAVYTRKSSEEGLEQDFNSLHAQREACESFIKSQAGEGCW